MKGEPKVLNVPQKLAMEITRVTELREQYRALDGQLGANVKPALLMMDRALEVAVLAALVGDAVTQISALRKLEGFTG